MDTQTSILSDVLTLLQKSLDTPWYLVSLVQVTLELARLVDAQAAVIADLACVQEDQQKAVKALQTKYSEVLYHLKSADK